MAGGWMSTSITAVTKRLAELHRPTPWSSTSDTAPSEIRGILEDLEFVERTGRRVQAAIADARERAIDEDPVRKWLWVLTDLANEAEYLLDSFLYEVVAKEVEWDRKSSLAEEEDNEDGEEEDDDEDGDDGGSVEDDNDDCFVGEDDDNDDDAVEEDDVDDPEVAGPFRAKRSSALWEEEEKDGAQKIDGDATGGNSQRATGLEPTDDMMFGKGELKELNDDGIDVVAAIGEMGKTTMLQHASQDQEVSSPLTDPAFRREMTDGVARIKKRLEELPPVALQLLERDGAENFDGDATGGSSQRATGSEPTDDIMFGRESKLKELVQLLLNGKDNDEDDGVDVVAVVGMGGIGKTTIAQHAFKDLEVSGHFDVKGWVCVHDDFDVVGLTKATISELAKGDCSTIDEYSILQIRLKDAVQGKRFLLVIDDIWNEDYFLWETFTAPLRYGGAKGSKILITTRNESVEQASEAVASLPLTRLSDEDGWLLFKRYAFRNRSEKPRELEEIGKKIVKKCGGLPLSVKVIASFLHHENSRNSVADEQENWRKVLESNLLDIGSAEQILGPLRLSYRHLPSYLKPCFGLCSIFPKGGKFECKYLIQLWNANGFLQVESEEELQNIGMKYISDLCSRSLLQMDGSRLTMHDLVHDLAHHASRVECHSNDSYQQSNLTVIKADTPHLYISGAQKIDDMANRSLTRETGLRTLIMLDSLYLSGSELSFPLLNSMDNGTQSKESITKYRKFICLRAISIHTHRLLQPGYFKNMKCLRYLKLEGISELPNSTFNLYNLQRLDLSGSSILQLPELIENLKSLHHLNLSGTIISELPNGICKLYNLRDLLLSKVPMLRLPNAIGNLHNLQRLDLSGSSIEQLPESISNLKSLHHLNLSGTLISELPNGIRKLYNLRDLLLSKVPMLRLPNAIGNLHNLQRLDLSGSSIGQLPESISNLKSLLHLDLSSTDIDELPEGTDWLCNLREVVLGRTDGTAFYLPSGIRKLSIVQRLLLSDFYVGNATDGHAGIGELKGLHLDRNKLDFIDLHNAAQEKEVEDNILINQRKIEKLRLHWGKRYSDISEEIRGEVPYEEWEQSKRNIAKHEQVLQSLKPHPNLRKLRITRFPGTRLPSWLADPSFIHLKEVHLEGFRKCRVLPPLSQLPSLQKLAITSMSLLQEVATDKAQFQALRKLIIRHCPWLSSIAMACPSLVDLKVRQCNSLKSISLYKLSALVGVDIEDCDCLEIIKFEGLLPVSLNDKHDGIRVTIFRCPRLIKIDINDCPWLEDWCRNHRDTELKGTSYFTYLPAMARGWMLPSISAVTKSLAELHRSTPGSSTSDPASSEILGILENLEFVEWTGRRLQAAIGDAQERAIDEEPVKKWLWVLTDWANKADYLLDSFQYQVVAEQVEWRGRWRSKNQGTWFIRQMADDVARIKERLEEIRKEMVQQDAYAAKEFEDGATGGSSQRARYSSRYSALKHYMGQ